MENSDFDKFIKSNTRKSLDVPDELDWENMNIPLPLKKKNRRFFFLLWGGLFILVSGSLVYLNNPKNPETEQTKNYTQLQNEKVNSNLEKINIEIEEKLEIPFNHSLKNNENKNITNTRPIDSPSKTFSEENLKTGFEKDLASAPELKVESFIIADSANQKTEEGESLPPKYISNSTPSINQLDLINLVEIQGLFSLVELPSDEKRELKIPTYFKNPTDNSNNNLKNSKLSVYLSFGLNTFQSNYSDANQISSLESAENQAIGNTLNLGLQYQLKKEFFATLGFSFQNLHHTFSFREELDPVLDFSQFQQINRTKRVFHNNYTQLVELNIGGGKSFSFGKNWGSQIALNINPSLKMKSSGRTLNEEESIIDIEDFAANQQFFLSAGAEVRLFYKIKDYHFFTSFGYKHALSNVELLNNSTLTLQPQIINLNLGVSKEF